MARKPMVSLKYDSDGCEVPPETEGALIARIRSHLNQQEVRKYWEYINGVTVCIAGPNQAYVYVEFHGLNWRELSPYHGKPARQGGRYWTFKEVRFSPRYWLRRIRAARANRADYRGFAVEAERRMRGYWHQERFNFWDVVDGINAALRKMSILGGYRLQLTAFKIPKEDDPMPYLMALTAGTFTVNLDRVRHYPYPDFSLWLGEDGKRQLMEAIARKDPRLAELIRALQDVKSRIGMLPKSSESQNARDELEGRQSKIEREYDEHVRNHYPPI